jgi:hypothetical protein
MVRQLFELSRQARVSLRDTIAGAEKRHDGSRTVKVGFDRSASPCYRVRTARDEIWENTVSVRGAQRAIFSISESWGLMARRPAQRDRSSVRPH